MLCTTPADRVLEQPVHPFCYRNGCKNRGDEETLKNLVYPDLEHGIDGIRWVTKCVESADKGGVCRFQVSLPISI